MGCCSSHPKHKHPTDKNQPIQATRPGATTIRAQDPKATPKPLSGQVVDNNQRIDTPQMTEEAKKGNPPEGELGGTKSQIQVVNGIDAKGKPRSYQYFDISPKVVKKNKIYHISSKFPVSKPYSNPSEWQRVFQKFQPQSDPFNPVQTASEDEIVKSILGLRNRNWIQEQLKLQSEMSNQNSGSLESLVTNRRWIQLREHFNWLVYSVASIYFQQKHDNKFNLPKYTTKKWTDGFEYKGVYFRVLPYEEAYYIHNEMQALKYVQIELLELNALMPKILQHKQIKEQLQKDVILPLICGVSCGGFYLYGSPVIYTQELDRQTVGEFYKNDTINNSKLLHNSVVGNYNSVQQMQAVINQSNMSYSYLHNNINSDFIQDSVFKFMPILKGVTTQNMIPIIDFEEFNERTNEEQKYDVELKYLLVNLFDILPRLSEASASTLLMKFPCQVNDEISYHSFPKNNYMEVEELKKMVNCDVGHEGDAEESDEQDVSNLFTKKFFSKHGWDFILMQRTGATVENKKATAFYNQRELNLKPQKEQAGNANMLFIDNYDPEEEGKGEQHSRYLSPQKSTILKKLDSVFENKIAGNVLVSAYNYKKDFKVQYSMINHTYSSNIETLFSVSVEQVVKIIEQSDNVYNSQTLKELLHRKGLNIRFLWIILSKLRMNFFRDMVMIDILLRVMRKIVNEEVKIKSKVQNAHQEGGVAVYEEFYQGFHLDTYKEVVTFYMNAILKRKFTKYKQVFDETLLGLFLSRMSILGILFSINLKKEEYIYLESKDILDDIIEAPSRNPVLFVNAVQSYFKMEFAPDFLRICRQDKHLLLSKSQPMTANDIKQVLLDPRIYFTIKEQAYFMLARQITHTNQDQQRKSPAKIKTKTEKDVLKQSFQKPRNNDSILNSQPSHRGGIGPQHPNDSSTADHDSKTVRNNEANGLGFQNKDTLNTIRQYKNIDRQEDILSPPLQEAKRNRIENTTQRKNDVIDLSRLAKRSSFQPAVIQEIIMPSSLYKLKTYLHNNTKYIFDDTSKIFVGETLTVLRSFYPMPNLDVVNEWVICMESLMKDVFTVGSGEQVLIEAFVYQALLIMFFEQPNPQSFYQALQKIRAALFNIPHCAPETIAITQVLFALACENAPADAERSYMIALKSLFYLYGDPRGRGNLGVPYTLLLSWKLSLIALIDDKRLYDSEFSDELFDACLSSLWNHRKFYREQQQAASLSTKPQHHESFLAAANAFDQHVERSEMQKQLFDIKKYKVRPHNLTVAGGIAKSNTQRKSIQNQASKVYASHNPHLQVNQTAVKFPQANSLQVNQPVQRDQLKSQSHVVLNNKISKKNSQKEYDIDMSDIDLEVEDENKNYFIEENFKNQEWNIGICPFPHWSIYRQQIAQKTQQQQLGFGKQAQSQQYHKDLCMELMLKSYTPQMFYPWFVKYNPMMYKSGLQWTNQMIREQIFQSDNNLISSSSSSAILSNVGLSHQSSVSSQTSQKEKRKRLSQSYSQQLGKEYGGVSKQDMSGVVFSWGTDQSGQLGQDTLINNQNTSNYIRILYPRMVVQLRDEIIKEICCGHSHTLVININGQVYGWGLNENSQLGLGNDSPPIVRKPVLNPHLSNIVKLSAGNEHSLAITKNGELYIWGAGGLLGSGDENKRSVPAKCEYFNKSKIQYAVCGGLHTIAVTKEGETYSWGSTEGGQLGLSQQKLFDLCKGKEIPVLKPQKIPALDGQQVIQVACGEAHTIVMTKEGKLYGWGMSNYGQLGLGFSSDTFEPGIGMEKSKVYEPREIERLSNLRIQKVLAGATFTLFLTDKGELYGCGLNDLGQLGLDNQNEEFQATLDKAKKGKHHQSSDIVYPQKVICFEGYQLSNIACGENHALACNNEQRLLWAWGMYRNGQLGLGEVSMKMNPRPVQTLCSSRIQRIACGSMHSLALIGDSSEISTFSAQYYANNDILHNSWQCDVRALSLRSSYDDDDGIMIEDVVPDDKESRVKNPK